MSELHTGRATALLAAVLLVPSTLSAQDWHTVTQSRALADQSELRVDVEYGAGRFVVGAADAGVLYRTRLRYDADVFEPSLRYAGNRLRIGLEGGRIRGRSFRAGELNLALSPSVPLDLEFRFGAGEAELELGGLNIRSLDMATGASRTNLHVSRPNPDAARSVTLNIGAAQFAAYGLGNLNAEHIAVSGGVGEVLLDFGGEWRRDASAKIEMGLGSLTIRLPEGLGVEVRRKGILAGFDGQGLIKRGDVYYSENWDDATRRFRIDLDSALGTVRVAWTDGSTEEDS